MAGPELLVWDDGTAALLHRLQDSHFHPMLQAYQGPGFDQLKPAGVPVAVPSDIYDMAVYPGQAPYVVLLRSPSYLGIGSLSFMSSLAQGINWLVGPTPAQGTTQVGKLHVTNEHVFVVVVVRGLGDQQMDHFETTVYKVGIAEQSNVPHLDQDSKTASNSVRVDGSDANTRFAFFTSYITPLAGGQLMIAVACLNLDNSRKYLAFLYYDPDTQSLSMSRPNFPSFTMLQRDRFTSALSDVGHSMATLAGLNLPYLFINSALYICADPLCTALTPGGVSQPFISADDIGTVQYWWPITTVLPGGGVGWIADKTDITVPATMVWQTSDALRCLPACHGCLVPPGCPSCNPPGSPFHLTYDAGHGTCRLLTVCPANLPLTIEATVTSDRVCAATAADPGAVPCAAGQQYISFSGQCQPCPATQFNPFPFQRSCRPAQPPCDARGLHTLAERTPTSDRVCSQCPWQQLPLDGPDGPCVECTLELDRYQDVGLCRSQPAPCSVATFQEAPATPTSARQCRSLTNCSAGQYVAQPRTPTSDRRCAPCPDGFFSNSTNPAACQPWTVCAAGTTYQCSEPSRTSDRECCRVQPCGFSEQEVAPATATTDRLCTCAPQLNRTFTCATAPAPCCNVSAPCAPTEQQLEVLPPTATSDRLCQCRNTSADCVLATVVCGPGSAIDTLAAPRWRCMPCQAGTSYQPATNQLACLPVPAQCPPGMEPSGQPSSPISGRQCRTCPAGTFKTAAASADRCQQQRACEPPSQFVVWVLGNATAETTCAWCPDACQSGSRCQVRSPPTAFGVCNCSGTGRVGRLCNETCPCQNGGQCVNFTKTCHCPSAYAGSRCEQPCRCENGGTCMGNQPDRCACPPGFAGNRCQFASDAPFTCPAYASLGERCTPGAPAHPVLCGPGLYCDASGFCLAFEKEYAGCSPTKVCAPGLQCRANLCTPPVQPGQPCSQAVCATGLYCSAGAQQVCAVRGASGASCDGDGECATRRCGADRQCQVMTRNVSCSAASEFGCPVGDTCRTDSQRCDRCALLGQACAASSDCVQDAARPAYCDADTKVCTLRKDNGRPCICQPNDNTTVCPTDECLCSLCVYGRCRSSYGCPTEPANGPYAAAIVADVRGLQADLLDDYVVRHELSQMSQGAFTVDMISVGFATDRCSHNTTGTFSIVVSTRDQVAAARAFLNTSILGADQATLLAAIRSINSLWYAVSFWPPAPVLLPPQCRDGNVSTTSATTATPTTPTTTTTTPPPTSSSTSSTSTTTTTTTTTTSATSSSSTSTTSSSTSESTASTPATTSTSSVPSSLPSTSSPGGSGSRVLMELVFDGELADWLARPDRAAAVVQSVAQTAKVAATQARLVKLEAASVRVVVEVSGLASGNAAAALAGDLNSHTWAFDPELGALLHASATVPHASPTATEHKSSAGIIGGALGALLAVAVLVALFVVVRRRRHQIATLPRVPDPFSDPSTNDNNALLQL